MKNLIKYLLIGTAFGFVITKSEVISWFRIQEMFRFQSFHMYGIIGSAVLVGLAANMLLRASGATSRNGEPMVFPKKEMSKGVIFGGLAFGLGWALTGACPGPIFALIGSGYSVYVVALLAALAGAWFYGKMQHRLPH
jgi:uncharacterized membrane protein YedE/YeeE